MRLFAYRYQPIVAGSLPSLPPRVLLGITRWSGHSRVTASAPVGFTTAAAKVRAAVSAAAGNSRGWSMDALAGHLTMTMTSGGFVGLDQLDHERVDCIDVARCHGGPEFLSRVGWDLLACRCSSTDRAAYEQAARSVGRCVAYGAVAVAAAERE